MKLCSDFLRKDFFASSRFPQPAHSVSFSLAAFLAWTDALKFCVPAASLYGGGAVLYAASMLLRKEMPSIGVFPVALLFDETI